MTEPDDEPLPNLHLPGGEGVHGGPETAESLHRDGPVRDVHGQELPGSRPEDASDVLDDPEQILDQAD
ncbi:hypothetical protein GIS00_13520 [Nakamurella sp. YIM 132087]|uniref:Uncharacterized protein n=1 Tax=Nakamurella alba TaxID=2665158 RepID=A0A7K1FNS5_9ACTN|nr:hypothetical protein [Nakamurella alba]MTD14959.1 hypothetical protein [Nakamurella alba]